MLKVKNILNGFYRFVTFDCGIEKALEALADCNIDEIGSDYAIVESNETGFETLRDLYGFKIGCVQNR